MKIYKAINNNIVSAYDENMREVVVMGRGIGFQAKKGADIPSERIDSVFVMSNQQNTDRLKALFEALPAEFIALTDEILTYATTHLDKRINESAYFTLADHIHFAVMRMRQGMEFHNVLLSEVRRFYPDEYAVGLHALTLIKERLEITMPEDEAASIALHIFNAEYDISVSSAVNATRLLADLLESIERETGLVIDEEHYYEQRLVAHLKYLTQRMVKGETLPAEDDGLFDLLAASYPREARCSETVAAFIRDKYGYTLSRNELGSLAIHLRRICAQQ